jgi:hypothetical protein
MPERTTVDIDILIVPEAFSLAGERLATGGWKAEADPLLFPDSRLGLIGRRFWKDGAPVDVITSDQAWVGEATAQALPGGDGLRVVPLAYLVLMKLDASRGVDQGDLTRMLGLAQEAQLGHARGVVERYMPSDRDDLEQYIEIGRLEMGGHPSEGPR